jgi:integrase
LSALAARGLAPPSVARALAAIAQAHQQAGRVAPHRTEGGAVVAEVLAGIRRSRAHAPAPKRAADADVVLQLLGAITGDSLAARRDRALIAFGMALAARRSELVALDMADLAWDEQGLRVTIRRSKTDQEGAGAVVAVPEGRRLTPLAHLRAWLEAAGITEGPVFRPLWKGAGQPGGGGAARGRARGGPRVRDARLSGHAVARIIQARALAAGLDPARFAGHSLRAGFVTAAARAGADVWKIQQVSRHKSMQMLSGYVRDARLFDDHAGEPFL